MARDALIEDLSKIQLIKLFEEVTGLFVSINPEKRPENELRRKIYGNYPHPFADF